MRSTLFWKSMIIKQNRAYSIKDIKPHEHTVLVPTETDENISLFTVSEILYREYMCNPNFRKEFELKEIIEEIREYRQRS